MRSPSGRTRGVIASLGQPKVAVMLVLGFSSGLPFLLTGNTLGYWLRDEGTTPPGDRIPLVGRAGVFVQVPLGADRRSLDAPIFGRFGRRRGWMLLSQLVVALGLSACRPRTDARPRRRRACSRSSSRSPRPRRTSSSTRGGSRPRAIPTSSGCSRPRTARLPRRAARHRRVDSDFGQPHGLADFVLDDGRR